MYQSNSFGKWVKAQRLAHGVRQAEFAKQVYCAEITLRKIEADERRPSRELARLIVRQFGVPPQDEQLLVDLARGALPRRIA